MKINHILLQNEDGIKFIRITIIIDSLVDVSPCLWNLFIKSVDDTYRYQFDVSLPYNPSNPKSHMLFPYACIELFIMNQIFNVFYEKYSEQFNEYIEHNLNINEGFNVDWELYHAVSTPIRPNEWNKLKFSNGDPSDRMWDMKFNAVGRGIML